MQIDIIVKNNMKYDRRQSLIVRYETERQTLHEDGRDHDSVKQHYNTSLMLLLSAILTGCIFVGYDQYDHGQPDNIRLGKNLTREKTE